MKVERLLVKRVKELWIEDTKQMRYNTDRFGRFQDVDMFCPLCRNATGTAKHCENSKCNDAKTALIAYTFKDSEGDIYFARDEIIHFNKYSSYARLYGNPPILALGKIETALAVEAYQNKVYLLERPPKGFLDIPGHNEDSLTRLENTLQKKLHVILTLFLSYLQGKVSLEPISLPLCQTKQKWECFHT